ncbi:MAG: sigma-70 family RNA polymerase sigma factor [Bacilli bacterium]|nr:sigma-70 family RNA polymerase sigma factor [Bacilli bacterium]
MNYRDYNDHELLLYISENNEEASQIMFDKYTPFIINTANKMYKYCPNTGLEVSDLIQEGMLGLNSAILTFKEQNDNAFYTYAKTCIERKMISLMVSSNRQKYRLLNESLSLNDTLDNDIFELEEHLGDNSYNPEYRLFEHETEEELINGFKKQLTDLEEEVFLLKIGGLDYKEIAEVLDKELKTIDNALQRIKIKLKKYLGNN